MGGESEGTGSVTGSAAGLFLNNSSKGTGMSIKDVGTNVAAPPDNLTAAPAIPRTPQMATTTLRVVVFLGACAASGSSGIVS